jgi:predicted porin
MKKSLLALAVLGAFAGAASAQSSVTIYGVADVGLISVDHGDNRENGVYSGGNAASRIGFKGVEDLGNGLKAEFVLENGFNVSDGSGGSGFSRLAFVGLDGGFGKVRLGRQETQVKEMLGQIDPFGAAGMANAHDFINGGKVSQRLPNQIVWMSNDFSGFSASLGYKFGEQSGDNSANRAWGARVGYANGPLNVQFAYEKENHFNSAASDDFDDKNALLGATYDFGAFKLHGIYGERKLDGVFGGTSDADKIRSYLLGATVPFGASAIRAEYIRNDDRDNDNADSNVYALSYTYAMSKRTKLYATYAHTSNDSDSALGLSDFAVDNNGDSVSGLALGVQHNF